jgi:hypothetical protein
MQNVPNANKAKPRQAAILLLAGISVDGTGNVLEVMETRDAIVHDGPIAIAGSA